MRVNSADGCAGERHEKCARLDDEAAEGRRPGGGLPHAEPAARSDHPAACAGSGVGEQRRLADRLQNSSAGPCGAGTAQVHRPGPALSGSRAGACTPRIRRLWHPDDPVTHNGRRRSCPIRMDGLRVPIILLDDGQQQSLAGCRRCRPDADAAYVSSTLDTGCWRHRGCEGSMTAMGPKPCARRLPATDR